MTLATIDEAQQARDLIWLIMVYTVKEVARLLGVAPATVYKLANNGELAHTRVGDQIRFTAVTLRSYLGLEPQDTMVIPPEPEPEEATS